MKLLPNCHIDHMFQTGGRVTFRIHLMHSMHMFSLLLWTLGNTLLNAIVHDLIKHNMIVCSCIIHFTVAKCDLICRLQSVEHGRGDPSNCFQPRPLFQAAHIHLQQVLTQHCFTW